MGVQKLNTSALLQCGQSREGFSTIELIVSMGIAVVTVGISSMMFLQSHKNQKQLRYELARQEVDQEIRTAFRSTATCLCNFSGKISNPQANNSNSISLNEIILDECAPKSRKIKTNDQYVVTSMTNNLPVTRQAIENIELIRSDLLLGQLVIESKIDANAKNVDQLRIPINFHFDENNNMTSCASASQLEISTPFRIPANAASETSKNHYFPDVLAREKMCRMTGHPLAPIKQSTTPLAPPPAIHPSNGKEIPKDMAALYVPYDTYIRVREDYPKKNCTVVNGFQICRNESLYVGGLSGVNLNGKAHKNTQINVLTQVSETKKNLTSGETKSSTFFQEYGGSTTYPTTQSTDPFTGDEQLAPDVSVQVGEFHATNGIPDGTSIEGYICIKGWWRKL